MTNTLEDILGKNAAAPQVNGYGSEVKGNDAMPKGKNAETGFVAEPDAETQAKAAKAGRLTYEELFKKTNPFHPPTQEELAREEKRKRLDKIFSAISDGISAFSNLYFTTQYAPDMYSGRNTMSERTKKRWDRLAAERDANMNAYIKGLMRARQADEARDAGERKWELELKKYNDQAERDKADEARKDAAEKRKEEMHDLDKQLMDGKITEQQHKAKKAEIEEKYAPEYERSRINRNNRSGSGKSGGSKGNGGSGRKAKSVMWPDGRGGYIEVDKSYLNDANIRNLYGLTRKRREYGGGKSRGEYLTNEEMLKALGAEMGNNDALREQVMKMTGNYSLGWGEGDHDDGETDW